MKHVKKANTILTVDDSLVADYVARGYDICTAGGKILKKSLPTDVNELQTYFFKYEELLKENERLKKEIAELQKPKRTKKVNKDE